MNVLKRRTIAPIGAGLAVALLGGCGTQTDGGAAEHGESVVVGMSDDVLSADPASGYDPGSWLLFNNVFQSLLSFPRSRLDTGAGSGEVLCVRGRQQGVPVHAP